jgi:signal transduction histidine kinase
MKTDHSGPSIAPDGRDSIARCLQSLSGELSLGELATRYLDELRSMFPELSAAEVWALPALGSSMLPLASTGGAEPTAPGGTYRALRDSAQELIDSAGAEDFIHWKPAGEPDETEGTPSDVLALHVLKSRGQAVALGVLAPGSAVGSDHAEALKLLGAIVGPSLHLAGLAGEAERARTALEKLEYLNKAKSDFVSIVSHEFRTPLTGIQGFSEMMVEEDLSYEEMKEFAGDINKDAKRLNRLITEMLDLDRMESGRMELTREPVELNDLIRGVVGLVQPNAPHHRVVLQLGPDLPELQADHDKLTQVVTNLLNNAVKYSPDGGDIEIKSQVLEDEVQVSVRDHGTGIPASAIESVFERYTRVESTARYVQGTGLGLPIVRQIVQMHGGTVWVESELGQGSTFFVRIPLTPDFSEERR